MRKREMRELMLIEINLHKTLINQTKREETCYRSYLKCMGILEICEKMNVISSDESFQLEQDLRNDYVNRLIKEGWTIR